MHQIKSVVVFSLLLSSVCEWEQYWFPCKEPSARGRVQEKDRAKKWWSPVPRRGMHLAYQRNTTITFMEQSLVFRAAPTIEALQIKRYLCSGIAVAQYWVLIADNLNNIGFFAPNTYAAQHMDADWALANHKKKGTRNMCVQNATKRKREKRLPFLVEKPTTATRMGAPLSRVGCRLQSSFDNRI